MRSFVCLTLILCISALGCKRPGVEVAPEPRPTATRTAWANFHTIQAEDGTVFSYLRGSKYGILRPGTDSIEVVDFWQFNRGYTVTSMGAGIIQSVFSEYNFSDSSYFVSLRFNTTRDVNAVTDTLVRIKMLWEQARNYRPEIEVPVINERPVGAFTPWRPTAGGQVCYLGLPVQVRGDNKLLTCRIVQTGSNLAVVRRMVDLPQSTGRGASNPFDRCFADGAGGFLVPSQGKLYRVDTSGSVRTLTWPNLDDQILNILKMNDEAYLASIYNQPYVMAGSINGGDVNPIGGVSPALSDNTRLCPVGDYVVLTGGPQLYAYRQGWQQAKRVSFPTVSPDSAVGVYRQNDRVVFISLQTLRMMPYTTFEKYVQ